MNLACAASGSPVVMGRRLCTAQDRTRATGVPNGRFDPRPDTTQLASHDAVARHGTQESSEAGLLYGGWRGKRRGPRQETRDGEEADTRVEARRLGVRRVGELRRVR